MSDVQPQPLIAEPDTAPEASAPPASRTGSRRILADWTITALLLLFGTTTLVQAFVIPTASMEGSLLVGDHLLVDKLAYAPAGPISGILLPYREVQRGDIIVFRYPMNIQENYVKRVVGVPGDRLHMARGQVFINGKPLAEPYTIHRSAYPDFYRDNFPTLPNWARLERGAMEMLERNVQNGEVVVPPGRYFALGDNRDESLDSRYWGFVPRENIIGKPLMVYWSYEAGAGQLAQPGVRVDLFRDLAKNFFRKTRWSRTGKLIRGHRFE